MKIGTLLIVALVVLCPLAMVAQDHGEVGVYAEYFRFQGLQANLGGLGGRVSVNTTKRIQLEAELGYDFRTGFAERFSNGITFSQGNSAVRVLHGMFGPKIQTNIGPIRAFLVAKGGFFNTQIDGAAPGPGFSSQINSLRVDNVDPVAYPGGGVEAYLGPIGLRLDAGDEIVFVSGKANHNFRMTFGPHIRF